MANASEYRQTGVAALEGGRIAAGTYVYEGFRVHRFQLRPPRWEVLDPINGKPLREFRTLRECQKFVFDQTFGD